MNRTVMRQELGTIVFSRRGLLILGILLLASIYALGSGSSWREARSSVNDEFVANVEEGRSEWRAGLVAFEEGSEEVGVYDARPTNISVPAVLYPGPLGDFAIGQGALQPSLATVTPRRNAANVFEKYQFDNPTTLRIGRFDFAFVVIVLLPLLLIAMTYDVVAEEREQGTLQMVLAQPVTLSSVAWTRILTRAAPLWIAVTAVTLIAATTGAAADSTARLVRGLLWVACTTGYMLFWLAVVAFVVGGRASAERSVALLVAVWGILVLALPAIISTFASSAYPAPSRLAFLSGIRTAQVEANKETAELTRGFLMDHPELTVSDDEVPGYYRSALLAGQLAENYTSEVMAEFASTSAARRETMDRLQFLAPPVLAQRVLQAVAGADFERHEAYQASTLALMTELREAVAPAVLTKQRISLAEYDQLPAFDFREEEPRAIAARVLPPTLFLFTLSAVLVAFAHARLRRSSFHESRRSRLAVGAAP